MIDKDLHLRRKKDRVEVITLEAEQPRDLHGKRRAAWNSQLRAFVPVRYVKSGRKGYLKGDVLESDFILIGKADPNTRWAKRPSCVSDESAAALEDLRERDVRLVKKRVLERVELSEPFRGKVLGDMDLSPSAHNALEQAIHMILAGA